MAIDRIPVSNKRQGGRPSTPRRARSIDARLIPRLWQTTGGVFGGPDNRSASEPRTEKPTGAETPARSAVSPVQDELLGPSTLPDYRPDERTYGGHVRNNLIELLSGQRNRIGLLTRYYQEPNRLGAMPVPGEIDAKKLRLHRVDEMLSSAVSFLCDGSAGGPASQREDTERGVVVQTRDFASRYPHIVVRRTDTFEAGTATAISTNWCALRIQNQDASIRTNRTLDAVSLGVEILKFVL